MKENLIAKIKDKTVMVCVVGLGYVGLPLLKRLDEVGFRTLGLDTDSSKIGSLIRGETYIKHIAIDGLQASIASNRCKASTNFSIAADADVIILCLPTPLNKYREPDLSFVVNSLKMLLPCLHPGQMLSLESTTYPGTTEEELLPRIESMDLKVGENFFLVYSPEREDPGNHDYSTKDIPKICGGVSAACSEVGTTFYSQLMDQVVSVSSTKVAEMTKILENTYRAVNIALVNEMKIVADKMGIDIFEVVDAAATKPFGFKAFYPGPGLGGHCIPIDPFYLTWKAREFGLHTRFIELAGEVNASMPSYVISKLVTGLNRQGVAISRSRILILGVAYKKNVDDLRESPSLEIIESLINLGAKVDYHDPFIEKLPKMRNYHLNMSSVPLNKNSTKSYDCVVISTDHDLIDYDLLSDARIIIDSRGRFPKNQANVVQA